MQAKSLFFSVFFLFIYMATVIFSGPAHAVKPTVEDLNSITINDLADALIPADSGVTVNAVRRTGINTNAGRFSGGLVAGLGFDTGVELSSGVVGSADDGTGAPDDDDADLDTLYAPDQYDISSLEIDLTPSGSTLAFQFRFATLEDTDAVWDAFGLFVDGTNIAYFPGNEVITTQTLGSYLETDPVDTEFTSHSIIVDATANVTPGNMVTLKFIVSDTGDDIVNSGVFIKGGSLTSTNAPTDISLSSHTVLQQKPVGTVVGTFSTTDPDVGDTHTYSLVSGAGDTDNASFTIAGSNLKTAEIFDYSVKNTYSIRVETDDGLGGKYEEQFTINVLETEVTRTLTVAKAGTGSGTVTSNPAGISCGADCTEAYDDGTQVTLTATAASGSTFSGWSGAVSGTTSPTNVLMNADKSVTATFTKNAAAKTTVKRTLTVTKTGDGTVTSSPAGINCGVDCDEDFDDGTEVTLTATPNPKRQFITWNNAVYGSNPVVKVTMNANKNVGAKFSAAQANPTVVWTGPAAGANDIALDTTVSAAFSGNMDDSTIDEASFTLSGPSLADRDPVTGTVAYDVFTKTAMFTPDQDLTADTTYTATISKTVKDQNGLGMTADYSWSFTTGDELDNDGDGVPNSVDAEPENSTVATPYAANGNGQLTLNCSNSGGNLANVNTVTPDDESVNQTGRPEGYDFPAGLVSFEITGLTPGETVEIVLTYPEELPADAKYYKVGPDGFAVFAGAEISGDTVTLTLTDGGDGDQDLAVDGVIRDPGGVAVAADEEPLDSSGGGGCSGPAFGADGPPPGGYGYDLGIMIALCLALVFGLSRRRKTE